jgi:hypothetical protein
MDIVQVIAPVGVAKKNPRNATRNVLQSAPTCLPISALRLAQYFCARRASALRCCVRAAVIDDANPGKALPTQITDDIRDGCFLV